MEFDGTPVFSGTPDLCTLVEVIGYQCPLPTGPGSYSTTQFIPKTIASVS